MLRTRAFSCTVAIDVRELADLGKFGKMLSQLLLIRFTLLSRLLPFGFWVMMQKSPLRERRTSGRSWIGNMSILMALNVLFEGGGGGDTRPQNVLVYNFPCEIPHAVVRDCLSVYGDVEYVRFLNWTHIADICDGERTVRMVRTWAIPRNLVIDGFPVKISYPGQAPVCDICGELGHIARNCALRGNCLECRQPGHLQRNCPVRLLQLQRSADPVDGSDAAPSRSDAPGAAPDASLSNDDPSSVVFSGVPPVDSRVDQSEGCASQSDLSDTPVVNPRSDVPGVAPGPSRPKDDFVCVFCRSAG